MFLPKLITRRDFCKAAAAGVTVAPRLLGQSRSASTPTNSPQRLTSGWEFHPQDLGGAWDVWRTDPGNDLVWQSVSLPHCFGARTAVDPELPHYEGAGWYRLRVEAANPFPNGRTLLHFEGAGQKSEIFVGLEKVDSHVGGYDEFVVDVTVAAAKSQKDAKNNGRVPIAVRCDNSRDLEEIPSSLNDFYRYGGLYRPVNLVYLPALSLSEVHIDPLVENSGSAKVTAKARLYNPDSLSDACQLSVRLLDPSGSVVGTLSKEMAPWKDEQQIASFEVGNPKLWSPSNPALYGCEVTFTTTHGTTTLNERFGFRSFEFVEHGPFKLNGEKLFLKGTQREEDLALLGAAMTGDVTRKELALIKAMGANFLGLAHHQQSGIVLDLCDEIGLLVFEEIPWSRGGLGGDAYQQQARSMLRNMIAQHYNHPSIILWGLGNENDWPGDFPDFDKNQIRAFMTELNEEAHQLDPSRKTFLRRCDFCRDIVDVYSPTLWAGWYHGPYTNYKRTAQQEMESVPHFLHVEWGADSHALRHSEEVDRLLAKVVSGEPVDPRSLDYLLASGQSNAPENGDWSETYACNLFDWHLKEQETMPWLTGSAQWIFKDFASPLRRDNPVPFVNQKGLVERDLTLKEGYFVFQSYWTDAPMVHLYGHSWPVRWGAASERKLVKVYSNCEMVELFANGVSCGVKRRDSQAFPAAGLHWLTTFIPGDNALRAVGKKNGVIVSDEIHFRYQIDRWQKPARLDLKETARNSGIATLEASLFDANRIPCLDARSRLRFELAGDGTLLDDLGTSRGARWVEAYNGRAQLQVRTNGGKSAVTVSSDGLPTAFLALD